MCFGWRNSPKIIDAGGLVLNGIPLTPTSSVKCLGLVLEDSLGTRAYTDSLKMKISSFTYCLHRLRRIGFPRSVLLKAYSALIDSSLLYCIPVWYSLSKAEDHRKIQIAQNNALRAVLGLKPRSSITHHFARLGLSDVKRLFVYRTACLANLSVHDRLTPPLSTDRNLFSSLNKGGLFSELPLHPGNTLKWLHCSSSQRSGTGSLSNAVRQKHFDYSRNVSKLGSLN